MRPRESIVDIVSQTTYMHLNIGGKSWACLLLSVQEGVLAEARLGRSWLTTVVSALMSSCQVGRQAESRSSQIAPQE